MPLFGISELTDLMFSQAYVRDHVMAKDPSPVGPLISALEGQLLSLLLRVDKCLWRTDLVAEALCELCRLFWHDPAWSDRCLEAAWRVGFLDQPGAGSRCLPHPVRTAFVARLAKRLDGSMLQVRPEFEGRPLGGGDRMMTAGVCRMQAGPTPSPCLRFLVVAAIH
jgi:hypothetical protein